MNIYKSLEEATIAALELNFSIVAEEVSMYAGEAYPSGQFYLLNTADNNFSSLWEGSSYITEHGNIVDIPRRFSCNDSYTSLHEVK